MKLSTLKRLDDFLFIDKLLDNPNVLNIIITPHKNLMVIWSRVELEHPRILGCRRTSNGLYVCKARLSIV